MFGGGFFGGGFDPFGDDMPGRGPSKPANTTELYENLGVPKDATEKQIKKAYRKIIMKEHPDKGGDVEKFKKAQQAWDILGDEKKRAAYDKGGLEGVENKHSAMSRRQAKTQDVVRPFPVTLEELYNGKTKRFAITRNALCKKCEGSGCKPGKTENHCDGCNGRGVRVVVRRMGPMIQQMQVACPDCEGEGNSISPEDKCTDCRGNKVARERKVVEVHVEKGMRDNDKVVIRSMADESPGREAGDLVFVVKQKKHDVFKRRGADLHMTKDVTLLEALTGVRFVLEHMDGQKYLISSPAGEVLGVNALKAVKDCGMPLRNDHYTRGNLFIKFNIVFPEDNTLSAEQLDVLKTVLPGPLAAPPTLTDDMEPVTVQTVDLDSENAAARERERSAYEESDEEDGHGGQQVRCAQQ